MGDLGLTTKTDSAVAAALAAFLGSRRRDALSANVETLTDAWRQNPFVRAGVSAIYRIVKGIPAVAVEGSRAAEKDAKAAPSTHPLAVLLSAPSPCVYGSELWAQVAAYRKLDGHAYVVLYGRAGFWERRGSEWPREMQAVNTRAVRYDESDVDQVTGAVRRWRVQTRTGREVIVPADAMMHLRDFDPRDPIGCSSPLDPAWLGMEADLNVDAYSRAWLANFGAIGTWLQAKTDLGPEERKAVLAAFNDAFVGSGAAGKTFLTGPDLEVKTGAGAQTSKDMEMPRLREWNRDVVKAVLGVTDFEIGRVADYNRANSESARRWLVENTILPELEAIESAFWAHVAEPVGRRGGQDVWMRFDRDSMLALKPALNETATTARTLIETGFDPAAVSDKLGLGLPFVALPDVPEAPTSAAPKTAPHVWIKKAPASRSPLSAATARRLNDAWRKHAELVVGKKWRSFTAARYSATVAEARKLTDIGDLSASTVDRLLHPVSEWTSGAEAAAKAGFKGLGAPLADNLSAEVGGFSRIEVGQATFAPAAGRRVAQMVKVGEHLRTRIRSNILKAVQEGGIDDIESMLRQRFGAALPSNAAVVARTEAGMFQNDVRQSLMVADGIDEKEWSAAQDEHTRPTHKELDGSRVGVNERFANGLLYPCEAGGPASEVIQCRCTALARIRERE